MAARVLKRSNTRDGSTVIAMTAVSHRRMPPASSRRGRNRRTDEESAPACRDGDCNPFNLNLQELRLLRSYRGLPDDERRKSVLEAMEAFYTTYL